LRAFGLQFLDQGAGAFEIVSTEACRRSSSSNGSDSSDAGSTGAGGVASSARIVVSSCGASSAVCRNPLARTTASC
jgi:hypothetical protein